MPRIKKGSITYDGKKLRFAPGIYPELKRVFWNKDVDGAITKMEQWLSFHPPKKDFVRFVCNWLMGDRDRICYEERKVPSRYDKTQAVAETSADVIKPLLDQFHFH